VVQVQKKILKENCTIKKQIDDSTSEYDKEKLQERLAKLFWWSSSNQCRCCN